MRLKRGLEIFSSLGVIALLLLPSPGHSGSYWWQRSDEGWFFYKDPPKPVEEEKEEPEEPKKPAPKVEVLPSKPDPLFTEIMKKRGEELLSRALEEPTIENVKAFMEHNYMMMKLSENFSLAWQKVLMMYPELESSVPVSDADKDLYFQRVKAEEDESLFRLSRRAGLFFFYDTSCSFCERQVYHLKRFQAQYPYFVIKPVTLDGHAFSDLPDTVMDNGIASRLGVDVVPSIFLAFPPDRFERISSGLLTASELKRRLIWYAKEIDSNYHHRLPRP